MPNASRARFSSVVFDQVWKKFRTGEAHDSLRDLVPALLRRTARAVDGDMLAAREFWAVRDVSFTVQPGEVLGIIGANGAGKSTVLKLLTRVLRATRGTIRAEGRIGALIEVAAGFHPDLTGRENVFLQGTIMGMRVREVAQKFDAIVEFAGVSDFIDTPVKRYSSGMNARLGFAIAAHIEPDILVIDEVLAVGDLAFQTRAFARLAEMAASGVPVIIVSHQLDRVASLSTRALVLDHGAVVKEGPPAECIAYYTSQATKSAGTIVTQGPVRLTGVAMRTHLVRSGDYVSFRVTGEIGPGENIDRIDAVTVRIRSTATGETISVVSNNWCGVSLRKPGPFAVDVELQLNVPPGVYMVEAFPYDAKRSRELQQNLTASLTVTEGATFRGRYQLNPRMKRVDPEC